MGRWGGWRVEGGKGKEGGRRKGKEQRTRMRKRERREGGGKRNWSE